MPKKFRCLFCPKLFDTFEDLMHHLELEHVGMDSQVLQDATSARETKKQLGDYLDIKKKGVGLECPACFDMFDGIDKLVKHGEDIHNKELDPKFIETLQKMIQENPDTPPTCQKCNERYFGLITTKINNAVQNICFNCSDNCIRFSFTETHDPAYSSAFTSKINVPLATFVLGDFHHHQILA